MLLHWPDRHLPLVWTPIWKKLFPAVGVRLLPQSQAEKIPRQCELLQLESEGGSGGERERGRERNPHTRESLQWGGQGTGLGLRRVDRQVRAHGRVTKSLFKLYIGELNKGQEFPVFTNKGPETSSKYKKRNLREQERRSRQAGSGPFHTVRAARTRHRRWSPTAWRSNFYR